MKKILFSLAAAAALLLTAACGNDDIADDMPVITDEGITANPVDCQVYNRGDKIPFRYRFTDNEELGNYNIEIHNNFDHHSHGTVAGDCALYPKKKAENPWVYNQSYEIPAGSQMFNANINIPIPKDIDAGDYHFMVRVTDKSGWQEIKAVSIKVN